MSNAPAPLTRDDADALAMMIAARHDGCRLPCGAELRAIWHDACPIIRPTATAIAQVRRAAHRLGLI